MAMFDNIEWTLVAEDKASGTFKKIALSAKELSSASDNMTESVNKGNASWKDIAKGVFAGQVALDAAKKAVSFLTDQVRAGIEEAMEYERVQAQLNAVLISTGGAAGLSVDALNDMADSMANLAIGGSETINSLQATLLNFTNITSANFERVTQTALDMATALNNGALPSTEQLTTAGKQLGKALNDPTSAARILRNAGVELTDGMQDQIDTFVELGKKTEAQDYLLNELSKTYEGRAVAASQTFEGRMVALNNSLEDGKKIIGQALLPTLSLLAGDMADATGNIKVNDDTMKKWQKSIFVVVGSIKTIIISIGGFVGAAVDLAKIILEASHIIMGVFTDWVLGAANLKDVFVGVFGAIKQALTGDFGGALDTLKNTVTSTFTNTTREAGEFLSAISDFGGSIQAGMDNAKNAFLNFAEQTATFDEVSDTINATAGAATDLSDAIAATGDSANEAQQKILESMEGIASDYEDAQEAITEELLDLETAHTESIDSIIGKLEELQTSLAETTTEYQTAMAEINKSEAERVIEQEQTIVDLQEQLSDLRAGIDPNEGATSSESKQIAILEAQLAKEQAAYEVYISQREGLDAEMAEARRRASLTEFERFIEDINAKRAEEQAAFDEKIAMIQAEVAEQETALAAENAVYEQKKAIYAAVQAAFQAFHDDYLANLEGMKNYTEETVTVMTTELARIISLFEEIKAVRDSAGLAGISVGSPTSATGETASSTNNSITQQVTINVTTQGDNATQTATDVVNEIRRQLELAGLASQ